MTTDQWTQLGTGIAVLYVAVRNEIRAREARNLHLKTHAAVEEVKAVVNGPLGESLRATASALTVVAHIRGNDDDIAAAIAARKRAEEHLSQANEIAAFKREAAAMASNKPR